MRASVLSLLFLLFLSQLINSQSFDPPLFCFEDAFLLSKNCTFEEQVKLLKNLEYDGIELEGLDNYEEKLADFARANNVNLALYPHSRFWLEKVGDSVRLIQKADRDNLGAVFRLCHFLKTDTRDSLEMKLVKSIPFLSAGINKRCR